MRWNKSHSTSPWKLTQMSKELGLHEAKSDRASQCSMPMPLFPLTSHMQHIYKEKDIQTYSFALRYLNLTRHHP
eukprot:1156874-Pelagomonas_calceolata.AAC.1